MRPISGKPQDRVGLPFSGWTRAGAAVLLAVLLAALGCSLHRLATEKLEAPRVSLRGVGLMKPTKQGWPFTVILEVHNPNAVDINLSGYDYEVWVEGKHMAQGASSQSVSLPANGQAVVEVPVLLKLQALPAVLPRLLHNEPLSYEVAGGFRLPETLGFRVPFRFKGKTTSEQGLEHLKSFLH